MLKNAIEKAAKELCLKGHPVFSADDLSVVLGFLLENLIKTWGIDKGWAALRKLIDEEGADIPVTGNFRINALLDDPEYASSLRAMALGRLKIGPEAPALRISPVVLSEMEMEEILGDNPSFGLIFGTSPILFQDTVDCCPEK